MVRQRDHRWPRPVSRACQRALRWNRKHMWPTAAPHEDEAVHDDDDDAKHGRVNVSLCRWPLALVLPPTTAHPRQSSQRPWATWIIPIRFRIALNGPGPPKPCAGAEDVNLMHKLLICHIMRTGAGKCGGYSTPPGSAVGVGVEYLRETRNENQPAGRSSE